MVHDKIWWHSGLPVCVPAWYVERSSTYLCLSILLERVVDRALEARVQNARVAGW